MSPYEVLGVQPDASRADIRRAYVALARRHHPDRGGDPAQMRRINEAWAALSSNGSPRERGWDPANAARPDGPFDGFDDFDDRERAPSFFDGDWVGAVRLSPRARLVDSMTLLALFACTASAALSFLFGMLFMSGPLLGFGVFCLFLVGVLVVARTLLAMGYHRGGPL